MKTMHRMVLHFGLAACLSAPLFTTAAEDDRSPDTDIWSKVRASLFKNRPISNDDGTVIQLEAPARAEDAATVPIAIKTPIRQTQSQYIKSIYLLVDRNPSPIAAVFTLSPESGRADIETRIRVEQYTWVRAIAEMSDGKLFMTTRYVKASGGCSAPAGKDQAAAMARLGKIKTILGEPVNRNQPTLVQLMVSHPNNSGLAMDQLTRLHIPAHYVRKINVRYGQQPILTAELDFSISENPHFRFYFVPRGDEKLHVEVEDTKDQVFRSVIDVRTNG